MLVLTALACASALLLPSGPRSGGSFLPDYVMPSGQPNGGAGEMKGATSWALDGNHSPTQLTGRHVFEIVFHGIASTTTEDWGANPPTKNVTSVSLYVPEDVHLGVTGTTPSADQYQSNWYLIHPPREGGLVPIHIPTTTSFTLSGRSFFVLQRTDSADFVWQNGQWVGNGSSFSYLRLDFILDKLMCDSMGASIDTRKAHGQPNREGALPGDANAPAREVNFANWFWKGGLFAGNMPSNSGDQSGTARIQLRTTSPESEGDFLFATLALYYLGTPTDVTGQITLGAFVPTQQDQSLSLSESLLTWATRWSTVAPTSGTGTNWSVNPISKITFGTSQTALQYANWGLTPLSGDNPWSFKHVAIAIDDETGMNPDTVQAWRYFASRQYHADDPTTDKDWAPRIWVLTFDGSIPRP